MIRTSRMICFVLAIALPIRLGSDLGSCHAQEATKETASKNSIQTENLKTGSRDWQLTRVRVDEVAIDRHGSRVTARVRVSEPASRSTSRSRRNRQDLFDWSSFAPAITTGPVHGSCRALGRSKAKRNRRQPLAKRTSMNADGRPATV